LTLDEFKATVKDDQELCEQINSISSPSHWLDMIIKSDTKEAQAFDSQAGGHTGAKSILKEDGFIFKHYTQGEFECYEKFKEKNIPPIIPAYGGRVLRTNSSTNETNHYIKLEDLTLGMKKACVMDCKLGTVSYEEDSAFIKKLKQGSADYLSTSNELGFRICGLKCYQIGKDSFLTKDKSWGVSITASTMTLSLKTFIFNGQTIRYDVFQAMIPEIQKILDWFNQQTLYKFYGCSILFVYDGIPPEDANTLPMVNVRMMDFAHVIDTVDGTKDESFIHGLKTIVSCFKTVVAEGEEAKKIQQPHNFKSYTLGTHICALCSKYIWMTTGGGFQCKSCNKYYHALCKPMVPDNCGHEKPKKKFSFHYH